MRKPPTGEEAQPTRATRDDMHAVAAHRFRHEAHDDLARVEPTLQRAERHLVLRFHVEALQRQACQGALPCTHC